MTVNITEKGLMLALESPDPVVRNLAIKREELKREAEKLDTFLGAYGDLAVSNSPTTQSAKSSTPAQPATPVEPPVSATEFGERVVNLLREHGTPMKFVHLHAAYVELYGQEPEQNLRKRLKRRPDLVASLPRLGYWPVGDVIQPAPAPVHGGNGAVAATGH